MDKKIILTIGISIILSVILSFFLFNSMEGMKKQAYVDTVKVFNEFELKKSLEKKMDFILLKEKREIDSLKIELQAIYNDTLMVGNNRFLKIREIESEVERKVYLASQNEISLTEDYNAQIWTQLNQYIKEFGKSKDLDLMLGANGNGSILYANEAYDLTEECILYVNNKFSGVE